MKKSNIFYGGIPIDEVDFEKEAAKELALLESHIAQIKEKLEKAKPGTYDYQYWTIKMRDANKRLEVGTVSLS